VKLREVTKNCPYSLIPSIASHSVEKEIIFGFRATKAHEIYDGLYITTVYSMREVLSTRTVSISSDEALRLACLMGLDMRKITSVSSSERMRAFWSLMARVPVGFVFSRAPHKLTQTGFHWAPSTFLGPLPKDYWAGPQGLDNKLDTIPTDSGLLVALPGYVFRPNDIQPEDILNNTLSYDKYISDTDGYWYTMGTQESWRKVLSTLDGLQRLALVLAKPLTGRDAIIHTDASLRPFNERWTVRGIIATVVHSQGNINYVSAHRHVTVTKLGVGHQRYFKAAKGCAQQVPCPRKESPPKAVQNRKDRVQQALHNESVAMNILTATAQEKCEQRADTALKDPVMMELCKAEARFCGTDDSEEEVTSVFRGTVQSLYQRGNVHVTERTSDDQKWYVD